MRNKLLIVLAFLIVVSCVLPNVAVSFPATATPVGATATKSPSTGADLTSTVTPAQVKPTITTPASAQSVIPTVDATLVIKSVHDDVLSKPVLGIDAVKHTMDTVCAPVSEKFISQYVQLAMDLHATHIVVSVPYAEFNTYNAGSPFAGTPCGDVRAQLALWVHTIDNYPGSNVHIIFRQVPFCFVGIYYCENNRDVNQNRQREIIEQAIFHNAVDGMYRKGDIVIPVPKPEDAGIVGLGCVGQTSESYTGPDRCTFASFAEYNEFYRKVMVGSEAALAQADRPDIAVCCMSVGDSVAGGSNSGTAWMMLGSNGHKAGILEDATVATMNGILCLDYYPGLTADPQKTYQTIVGYFKQAYPDVKVGICGWGSRNQESNARVAQILQAIKDSGITFFIWTQAGPAGRSDQEPLFEEDAAGNIQPGSNGRYEVVKSFFTSLNP